MTIKVSVDSKFMLSGQLIRFDLAALVQQHLKCLFVTPCLAFEVG